MKKTLCFLLVLLSLAQAVVAQHQWTWLSGQEDANSPANYGLPLISSPNNYPGSRTGAIGWTDNDGNFWLFGGQGFTENGSGLLNDLWRYNPESSRWTWISGSSNTNRSGTYGVRGLPLPTNSPGARRDAVSWIDNAGNLWLFGGSGYANGGEAGLLNDLWRFSPATLQWTWMGGDNEINRRGEYGRR
jgi:N-acetylneuraminic acid mutarotase